MNNQKNTNRLTFNELSKVEELYLKCERHLQIMSMYNHQILEMIEDLKKFDNK